MSHHNVHIISWADPFYLQVFLLFSCLAVTNTLFSFSQWLKRNGKKAEKPKSVSQVMIISKTAHVCLIRDASICTNNFLKSFDCNEPKCNTWMKNYGPLKKNSISNQITFFQNWVENHKFIHYTSLNFQKHLKFNSLNSPNTFLIKFRSFNVIDYQLPKILVLKKAVWCKKKKNMEQDIVFEPKYL